MAAQCSLTAETKANGNLKISEMVLHSQALGQVGGAAGEGVRQAARVLPGLGRGQPLWRSRRLHRRGEDQGNNQTWTWFARWASWSLWRTIARRSFSLKRRPEPNSSKGYWFLLNMRYHLFWSPTRPWPDDPGEWRDVRPRLDLLRRAVSQRRGRWAANWARLGNLVEN